VVYPMNAVANSQLGELEKFISFGPPGSTNLVTYRRYTGQEDRDERDAILHSLPRHLAHELRDARVRPDAALRSPVVKAAQGLRFLVEGECLGVFDLYGFELVGVEAEELQDCWRDLGGLDGRVIEAALAGFAFAFAVAVVAGDWAAADDEWYRAVLGVVASVLGDLALLAGVDDAVLGDADHVGDAGVAARNADEAGGVGACVDGRETRARVGLGVAVDVVADAGMGEQERLGEVGSDLAAVGEPDQHAVVVDREGHQVAAVPGRLPGGVEVVDDRAVGDARQRRGGLR